MIIIGNLLLLFAGLGVFLIGMQLISYNMQNLAGNKISKMLSRISNNKIAGIGLGAGAAAILESSSATTVILLGLVNAGIVNLLQATLIIMGANIGTTFTVILLSFSYLPIGEFLAFLTLVGASIIMSCKTEKTRSVGFFISGIGLIFAGIQIMSAGISFLKDSPSFTNFIGSINNPFVLLIVGLFVSGIVQSGTAITGIAITMCEANIMPVVAAFYIILGSNIGTCATAMIASIGTQINTKRTALIHLLFNLIGVILFLPLLFMFGKRAIASLTTNYSASVLIAFFHIIFNIVTTIILMPFAKEIAALSKFIIRAPKNAPNNI
ncbi:MAG: Na/Pi symporter [Christensenellaceae bacterium]|jgi:phosphate:Na+ symporter|nr:Na/Pi symporter [Christensenellaceae bacterium]